MQTLCLIGFLKCVLADDKKTQKIDFNSYFYVRVKQKRFLHNTMFVNSNKTVNFLQKIPGYSS